MPLLVHMVASPQAVFAWKRDAALAMFHAIRLSGHHIGLGNVTDVLLRLDGRIRLYLWDIPVRNALLQALMDFMRGPDLDGVLLAVHVLDRLLRALEPESLAVFEHSGGVKCLEQVCVRGGEEMEVAATLAADLLDNSFSNEDDDDDEPEEVNDRFAFAGIQPSWAMTSSSSSGTGRGRGRGMTLSAWMQQQQSG
jgi:hypothetical protein